MIGGVHQQVTHRGVVDRDPERPQLESDRSPDATDQLDVSGRRHRQVPGEIGHDPGQRLQLAGLLVDGDQRRQLAGQRVERTRERQELVGCGDVALAEQRDAGHSTPHPIGGRVIDPRTLEGADDQV